jgi:hypothetical protein
MATPSAYSQLSPGPGSSASPVFSDQGETEILYSSAVEAQLKALLPHILKHDTKITGEDSEHSEICWHYGSNFVFQLSTAPGLIFKIDSKCKELLGSTVPISIRYQRHQEIAELIKHEKFVHLRTSEAKMISIDGIEILIEKWVTSFDNPVEEIRQRPDHYNSAIEEATKLVALSGLSDIKWANVLINSTTKEGTFVLVDTDERRGAALGFWGNYNRPGLITFAGSMHHIGIISEVAQKYIPTAPNGGEGRIQGRLRMQTEALLAWEKEHQTSTLPQTKSKPQKKFFCIIL